MSVVSLRYESKMCQGIFFSSFITYRKRYFRQGCDAIKTKTFSQQSGEHVTAYLWEKQLCLEP